MLGENETIVDWRLRKFCWRLGRGREAEKQEGEARAASILLGKHLNSECLWDG